MQPEALSLAQILEVDPLPLFEVGECGPDGSDARPEIARGLPIEVRELPLIRATEIVLMYVDDLIGPSTVNTLPPETWKAFVAHGTPAHTLGQDPAPARAVLERLEAFGICMEEVHSTLQKDGVTAFAASLDSLLATLEKRRQAALGAR